MAKNEKFDYVRFWKRGFGIGLGVSFVQFILTASVGSTLLSGNLNTTYALGTLAVVVLVVPPIYGYLATAVSKWK